MAVLNHEAKTIQGVALPYQKLGFIGIHNESVSINVEHKCARDFQPLHISSIQLSAIESQELSDTLRSATYSFLKIKGLIVGEDC